MPLLNTTTITKPAVAEKTFPHLWITNIIVSAPSTKSGKVKIETVPFNGDTGEIGSGEDMVAIETSDLWEAIGEVPELQTAMGAIFASVEPLRAWIAAKEAARLAALEAAEPE